MLEFWPPTGVSPQQCCTTKPPLYSIKQIPVCFSAVLVGRPVFAKCDSMSVMGEIMIWTSKTYDGGGCIYNLRWHLVVSLSSLTMATSSLAVGGPTFQLYGCHWVPRLEGTNTFPVHFCRGHQHGHLDRVPNPCRQVAGVLLPAVQCTAVSSML